VTNNYGLLYRDVAFLPQFLSLPKETNTCAHNGELLKCSPTICIEIKAKQGYEMDDDAEAEVTKCRYCYFQYLKLQNNRIDDISSYCPIDLFSAIPERMNRAICGLLENPQNNLKMFEDGKMIYNEYSEDKSPLRKALTQLFPDVCSEK